MQRAEALANRKEASPQEFTINTASAYNRKPLVSRIPQLCFDARDPPSGARPGETGQTKWRQLRSLCRSSMGDLALDTVAFVDDLRNAGVCGAATSLELVELEEKSRLAGIT